jgi:hypothetical protein
MLPPVSVNFSDALHWLRDFTDRSRSREESDRSWALEKTLFLPGKAAERA